MSYITFLEDRIHLFADNSQLDLSLGVQPKSESEIFLSDL